MPFWVDKLISEDTVSGTQDSDDLLATPSQFDKFGLTLVRTILQLTFRPTTLFAAVGLQAYDVAMALLEQDAASANVFPDMSFADDSPGRGWIYRNRVMVEDHTTAGAIVPTSQRLFADLKGMRKINDMELFLLFENNSAQGTSFTVHAEGLVRMVYLR